MAGSIQKKNGRYYIVLPFGKKRKWERVPDPNTKKNAEKLLAQRQVEMHRGEYRDLKKSSFEEFAERWFRDYVDDPNHIKPSTAGTYRSVYRKHLQQFFGPYPWGASPQIWSRSSFPSYPKKANQLRRFPAT